MGAKRSRGRPRNAPGGSTLGIRLTREQRAALEQAAGGLDLSTWIREVALARAGRSDLGADGQAARVRAALAAGMAAPPYDGGPGRVTR